MRWLNYLPFIFQVGFFISCALIFVEIFKIAAENNKKYPPRTKFIKGDPNATWPWKIALSTFSMIFVPIAVYSILQLP